MPYANDIYYHTYHPDDFSRQPLILIHGAGGNRLSWPGQLRRLSGYRVFTLDLPGHGKSRGHGLQRIADYGEAVGKWIHSLELPKVLLAGHSLGGAIALWLGLNHPELVQGLVLISTGARLPVNSSLLEKMSAPQELPGVIKMILGWSFAPDTADSLIEGIRRSLEDTRPSVLEGDFRAADAFDLSGQLNQVKLPSLVMVGDLDKMTPLRFSEQLAAGIPEAALIVIPGAGHMLPLEAPGAVGEGLRGFSAGLGS